MRSMSTLLASHINDLSEINKKEPGKESESEFINSLSSMLLHYQVILIIYQRLIKKNLTINLLMT